MVTSFKPKFTAIRLTQGGNDVPMIGGEMICSRPPNTGGTAGDQNGFHIIMRRGKSILFELGLEEDVASL